MANPEGCNQYKRCGGGRGPTGEAAHRALRSATVLRGVHNGLVRSEKQYFDQRLNVYKSILRKQPHGPKNRTPKMVKYGRAIDWPKYNSYGNRVG